MSETCVINWTQLLELRELQPPGEPDIVVDLIRVFTEDSALRNMRLEAHAIKGSSCLMGAGGVTELAQAVESAAETGGVSGQMIESLDCLLEAVRCELLEGPPH